MSDLSVFLKVNQEQKENVKFAASKAFKDEDDNPVEWEFRALTTAENDRIASACVTNTKDKKGKIQQKMDFTKYIARVIATCTVYPDLNAKELQDSYGVMSAEDLVKEMISNPGEYAKLSTFLQEYNGFDETEADLIENAKN